MSDRIRKRFVFSGDVQGVGFRWRARAAAHNAGATGWVRNNFDGSVTMELQGDDAQIDRVVQSLDHDRYIRIDSLETRTIPVDPEERGFETRDDFW